ncbi:MAG: hypothetical protein ACJAT7_003434 [Psychromonas sp.]|jgi:hypothetical protein
MPVLLLFVNYGNQLHHIEEVLGEKAPYKGLAEVKNQ